MLCDVAQIPHGLLLPAGSFPSPVWRAVLSAGESTKSLPPQRHFAKLVAPHRLHESANVPLQKDRST